jgi:hypothetical protein
MNCISGHSECQLVALDIAWLNASLCNVITVCVLTCSSSIPAGAKPDSSRPASVKHIVHGICVR